METKIDPLQRVFIPVERRNMDGTMSFRTIDGMKYKRGVDGTIRRVTPKVNGKEAKRRRQCRQS
jgi:hypothetical protein